MKRRAFITVGSAAAWPVVACAYETPPRIGVLTLQAPQDAGQHPTQIRSLHSSSCMHRMSSESDLRREQRRPGYGPS
jgi:hypothetical protein